MSQQTFNLGDVVWCKMRGYSFPWPSIISKDSEGEFKKPAGKRNQFHVSFLSDNSHCWIHPTSLTLFHLHDTGPYNSSVEVPKRWEVDFNKALVKANNILHGVHLDPVSPAGPTPGSSLAHARVSRRSQSLVSESDIDNFLHESRIQSESNRPGSSVNSEAENAPPSQPLPSPFLFLSPSQHSLSSPSPSSSPNLPQIQENVQRDPSQFYLNDFLDPDVPGPVPNPAPPTSSELAASPPSWTESVNRALKLLLFLPQLLLRQGGRGGKRGQAGPGLPVRFDLALSGDWSALIDLWKSDLLRLENKEARRQNIPRPAQTEDKLREQVLDKISCGQISRAARRIDSHGIADLDKIVTKAALQRKFPARSSPLPVSVPRGQCVQGLENILKDAMLQIEPGTAAGPGGGRGEYLTCLAQHWNIEQLHRFSRFSFQLLHGDIPPWFVKVCAAITTVPLYKTADKLDDVVRPIGVKNKIVRLLHGISAAQNRSTVDDHLHPVRLGVSKAGAHKLIHCLRMSYELPRDELGRNDWVLVALDFDNAHSSLFRGQVLEQLSSNPNLAHMATSLAPITTLVYRGKKWGTPAGEGTVQGDAEAGQCFNFEAFVKGRRLHDLGVLHP